MRPFNHRITAVAAAIGLAGAVLATPAAAQAATTALTLDCDTVPYSSQTMYVKAGDTFTFSLTGFDNVYDYNDEADIAALDPAGDTYVVSAGQSLSFEDSTNECENYFDVEVVEAAPETVPSGDLLFSRGITIPVNPQQITVSETVDGEHFLGDIPTCGISTAINGQHVYGTLEVTVLTAGVFTFRGISSSPDGDYVPLKPFDPIADPFLAVYRTFDPAQPDVGVVGCNDDLNDLGAENPAEVLSDGSILEGHQPYFTAQLTPGRYTLVLSVWEDLNTTDFAAGYAPFSELDFTPGAKTTNFQLWGPAGSLLIGAPVAPAITSAAPPAIAPVGAPYRFAVTASGTGPIVYAIASGALPAGLTLDPTTGVISGTPTVGGVFTFAVSATNAAGTTSASYTITTAAAAAAPGIRLPVVSG